MLRRSALRGLRLVGLACANPDAKLINACDDLIAIQAEMEEMHSRRLTITDEGRTAPELDALLGHKWEIEARLSALPPPSSMGGVMAMARVAVARWHANNGDELWADDFDTWVHLKIVEFLAADDV